MAAPCYLCDCCHGAFECSAWFGDHGVMAQMKVQCLYNVRRMFTSTCIEDVRDIGLREKKNGKKKLGKGHRVFHITCTGVYHE